MIGVFLKLFSMGMTTKKIRGIYKKYKARIQSIEDQERKKVFHILCAAEVTFFLCYKYFLYPMAQENAIYYTQQIACDYAKDKVFESVKSKFSIVFLIFLFMLVIWHLLF